MRGIRIGSIFGIPIRLGVSFLLVLPLFAYAIGIQIGQTAELINAVAPATGFVDPEPIAGGNVRWVVGLVAAVGLFVGVLLHELGHSVTAMRYGFEIESITLWLLGGIASLTEMPEDWRQEFVIAIMGPVVSVALGGLFYVALFAVPAGDGAVLNGARFVVGYLAVLNVALAVFNMLPGFPMDGGRVLRALLARNRPYAQATQTAARVGKAFAVVLGLVGLFAGGGLLLVVLAFFIYIAASGEARQTALKAAFENVTVGDIMTPRDRLSTVDAATTVADLFDRMMQETYSGYPVLRNDELVGVISREDARDVREVEHDAMTVADRMRTDLTTVTPDTDVITAYRLMQQSGLGRLPVVDESGRLVGLVSGSDVTSAFEIIQSRPNVKPREGVGRIDDPGVGDLRTDRGD